MLPCSSSHSPVTLWKPPAAYFNDVGIKTNLLATDTATNRAANRALEYSRQVNFHGTPDFDIQGWRVRQSSVTPRGSGIEHLDTEPIVRAPAGHHRT